MRKSNEPPSTTKLHKVKTLADDADVSERTVLRWIARGELVAHKIGGAVRVSDADWKTFLAVRRKT